MHSSPFNEAVHEVVATTTRKNNRKTPTQRINPSKTPANSRVKPPRHPRNRNRQQRRAFPRLGFLPIHPTEFATLEEKEKRAKTGIPKIPYLRPKSFS